MSDQKESVITYDHFKLLKEWLETGIFKDCSQEELVFLVFNVSDVEEGRWNIRINTGICIESVKRTYEGDTSLGSLAEPG